MAAECQSPINTFKPDLYKGKVFFCTGGGSGICKSMVEALMRFGASGTIFGRTKSRLDEAVKDLSSRTGSKVIGYAGDVRMIGDLEAALKATEDTFGKVDIVICGAAGNFLSLGEKISVNGFKSVIDIDLLGTFHTAKAALPYLKKTRGQLVCVSATFHLSAMPMQTHCAAAKAGIDAMVRHLALEWGQYGIRFNGIAPGPVADTTGMDKLTFDKSPQGLEAFKAQIPLRALCQGSDIADACLFLCSPAARMITGVTLVVDGGFWFGGSQTIPAAAWQTNSKL